MPVWPVYAGGLLFAGMLSVAAAAAPRTVSMVMADLKFGPVPGQLHVGDRLTFVNRDIFQHSATADDKSFDVDLKPGQQGSIVLKRPGAYSFICKYHPGMKGRIVVGR